VRFGIWSSPARPWPEILQLVSHCEATGWDSAYFADHFMPNGPDETPLDGDTLECWSTLSALAVSVPRLTLGSLVTSVTYRHPAVLAKVAAAVDRLSQGRLVLGVGAGWQENEHASYGIALGSMSARMDRFEEALAILESMLHNARTTFAGTFFSVTDAPNQPAPVQDRLPIMVGGAGERRTMRMAARYGDRWNSWATPDVLDARMRVLHERCEEIGRDSREISVSTQALLFLSTDESWLARQRENQAGQAAIVGTPAEMVEIVGRFQEAGADELIIPDFTLGSGPRRLETCDLFIEEVARHFR
jgi:F420-dependent oxidoreductase-like protein